MVSGSISFSAGCSWSPGFLNTSFQALLMPSSISFKRSSKVIVRPLKVMVSFPFRALCHVFSVLSSLLENKLSKRSHFDSPYIMFPNMKIFYCFPKNCQNFKPEYVSKSMISKAAPLLQYMLGLVLTHFHVAWTNSFLNRQAQQEKSQRPLCSTCADDSTIASGRNEKMFPEHQGPKSDIHPRKLT